MTKQMKPNTQKGKKDVIWIADGEAHSESTPFGLVVYGIVGFPKGTDHE